MKTLFTLLAGFLLVTQVVAQTTTTTTTTTASSAAAPASAPEELGMLATPALLKTYALSEVAAADSFVWGQSILASVGEVRSIYVKGDVDEVIGELMFNPSNKFKFKVRDTSTLSVYGSLVNSDGDVLFNSYASVTPVINGSGVLSIYPTLRLYMNMTIPVKFEGAQHARIEYIDPSTGESWTENLNVSNGKIYFPVQYAGKGTLVIGRQYPSGNTPGYELEVAYTLKDGLLIQSKDISGQVGYVGIQNYKYANDKFMAQTGLLLDSADMEPPAKDQWSFVSPPTGAIKLETTPVGTSRPFKMTLSFRCEPSALGSIEAYIYDPDTVDSEGFVNEYPGIVNITSYTDSNGIATTTVVSITWNITNNGIKANSSKWRWRLESAGFNKQKKPTRPYYYNGGSSDKG